MPVDVTYGGSYDGVNGRLRWGPFLDGHTRVLSYRLIAPMGFAGEILLAGEMSSDGRSVRIEGERLMQFGERPVRNEAVARLQDGRLTMQVWGPIGAVVAVETSGVIEAGAWQKLTEYLLTSTGQIWTLPGALVGDGKFLRVSVTVPTND
jgi:hypothetical protein